MEKTAIFGLIFLMSVFATDIRINKGNVTSPFQAISGSGHNIYADSRPGGGTSHPEPLSPAHSRR
jgi:hypothetical protein